MIESAKLNKLNIYKYINYRLEEFSQFEDTKTEEDLEKYLPWSKDLPDEIKNFEGEYKEMNL